MESFSSSLAERETIWLLYRTTNTKIRPKCKCHCYLVLISIIPFQRASSGMEHMYCNHLYLKILQIGRLMDRCPRLRETALRRWKFPLPEQAHENPSFFDQRSDVLLALITINIKLHPLPLPGHGFQVLSPFLHHFRCNSGQRRQPLPENWLENTSRCSRSRHEQPVLAKKTSCSHWIWFEQSHFRQR